MPKMSRIPHHVGYIVDGNRRWAKAEGVSVLKGHQAGYSRLRDVAMATFRQGVDVVSAYVFSTENWNRSKDEVKNLMALFVKALADDVGIFDKNNIRLRVVGSRQGLSKLLLRAIDRAERLTAQNDGGELALCMNYGGHKEITDAVKKIVQSGVASEEVTEQLVADNLYQPDIPPLDVVVRTSGEQRLSNFMLWRASYSELIFVDKYWPDMTDDDVAAIMTEYNRRSRRFGE